MKTTCQKSVMTARTGAGSVTISKPCGVCIQELAMMIQSALKWAPTTTISVAKNHSRGPSRLPPNSISPRNPPSRKNANTPSAASRLPKTLPTNRE